MNKTDVIMLLTLNKLVMHWDLKEIETCDLNWIKKKTLFQKILVSCLSRYCANDIISIKIMI